MFHVVKYLNRRQQTASQFYGGPLLVFTMDRASELRAMMKAKSGNAMSGKDKAKYLKTLREGKKEEVASCRPTHSTTAANFSTASKVIASTVIASTDDGTVPAKVKQVKIFHVPSLTAASSNVVQSGAPASSISGNRTATSVIGSVAKLVTYDDEDDEGTAERIIPSSRITSLKAGPPAGFFDDAEIVVSRPFSQPEDTQTSLSYLSGFSSEVLPILPKRPTINAADEYTGEIFETSCFLGYTNYQIHALSILSIYSTLPSTPASLYIDMLVYFSCPITDGNEATLATD